MAQLGFDALAAAFEDVHGDLGLVAVFERDGGGLDGGNFIGREETHAVDENEISHGVSVRATGPGETYFPPLKIEMWDTRTFWGALQSNGYE